MASRRIDRPEADSGPAEGEAAEGADAPPAEGKATDRRESGAVVRRLLPAGLVEPLSWQQELFDELPVLLQSVDDAGRLTRVNRHWLDAMGYGAAAVLGRPLLSFMTPESQERARRVGGAALRATGKVRNLELEYVTRAGQVLEVLLSVHARLRDGRVERYIAVAVDVTEKRRAAEALRRSEIHFRRLFEQLADAVYLLTPDGIVVDVNGQACRDMGRSREELVGHAAWEFSTTPPARIRQLLSGAAQDGGGPLETTHVRKDGSRFPVEVRVSVFEDDRRPLLLAIARDVAVRRQAEAALGESEARFAAIFGSATDAMVLLDEERVVALFNRSAERMFRCSADDVVGRPLDPFLSPELRQRLEECIPCRGRGESDPYFLLPASRFQAVRAGGEHFPVEASLSVVRTPDRTHYCIDLRDLDELARAESALGALREENAYLEEELRTHAGNGDIAGSSPALRRVLTQVRRVADTDATVLLTGETGTGKELIATAIHRDSRRAGRLLVRVNCAALPAGLVESELFGHERGAFTGAIARKVGRFELADGGTLFLDEIGELPLEFQAKLLRVLQEGEFERVGGARTLRSDVRLIAATNRDLATAVQEGRFRADLFYRLNVFPIHLPPLRERRGDIPEIARHLLRKHAARMGRRVEGFHPDALAALTAYDWPGNVRELENVVERALVLADGPLLRVPGPLHGQAPSGPGRAGRPLTLDEAQRAHILAVLELTGWRVSGPNGAARILGVKPTTLETRMQKLRIQRPHPRSRSTQGRGDD